MLRLSNWQETGIECSNLWTNGGSDGKESSCNAEDPGFIPGSGRSSGEANG